MGNYQKNQFSFFPNARPNTGIVFSDSLGLAGFEGAASDFENDFMAGKGDVSVLNTTMHSMTSAGGVP